MHHTNNSNLRLLCHKPIYDSSYDYTVYDMVFVFNSDEEEECENLFDDNYINIDPATDMGDNFH